MNSDTFLHTLEPLRDCTLCPRECHVNRFAGMNGYCKSDVSFNIASVCIHRGEEPVISGTKGICNIFFTNCNLQCIYCQNHQISNRSVSRSLSSMDLSELLKAIIDILETGINLVGFVSPSHFIPQMKVIIQAVNASGYYPKWLYNTNGYDKTETLRTLEGVIDVYLPDLKYLDESLAYRLSDAKDYPDVAMKALREMFRQKGSTLILSEEGIVESGMIIRHLVLPGQVENSLKVLKFIADALSPRVHVSLMSQFYPAGKTKDYPDMNRGITANEYKIVQKEMEKLGMYSGWGQEFESKDYYKPEFEKSHPFEHS